MGHGFRFQRTTWMVAALAAALVAPAAWAVEFTQNTLIAANDPTYDGQDIIITGCTVTINGYHPFNSLLIRGNGVVTHSTNNDAHVNFMDLDISGSVTIEPGSRVDVSGKGYAAGRGPGAGGWVNGRGAGGGHGGNGGNCATGAAGGLAYGSVLEPITFGSGGGDPGNGGPGGGAVRLAVGGTLTVDGTMTANGGAAQAAAGGGGAGGSICLTVGTLAGSGTITANGGSKGGYSEPGGGAGGRIAIYYGTNTFSGATTAYGNAGSTRGGAGTIYSKADADPVGAVYISNGGNSGAWTPVTAPVAFDLNIVAKAIAYPTEPLVLRNLTVGADGYLTSANEVLLDLSVQQHASIVAGGYLTLDTRGYAPGAGPGAGGWVNGRGAGGGHGGNGGNCATGAAGGLAYGSVLEPITFGSGGGDPGNGGPGGGAVRLAVGGSLTVDGALTANGGAAQTSAGGGGAGGSLYLTVGTLAGSGTITANGGSKGGYSEPGGGAGGRIAIYYGSKTFSGAMTAYGNTGSTRGGAGTIYSKADADPVGALYVSNGGTSGAWTPITSPIAFDLSIAAKAIVYPTEPLVLRNLTVGADGYLTSANEVLLDLSVQQHASIVAGGYLTLDTRGYAPGAGPGAGGWVNGRGAGGGHGGNGGDCATGAAGGLAYGSVLEPIDLGSGGGGLSQGGRGGGAVRATVGGTLTVDGVLTANGAAASTADGGGGAGGSIYLTVGTLAGSGTITANGGSKGGYSEPGGGAGGRIAIYYGTNTFSGATTAYGNAGWTRGGAGTIYRRQLGNPYGELWLDNNGNVGAATPIGSIAGDLTIGNGAWAYPTEVLNIGRDLLIAAGGKLTHLAGGPMLAVNVGGNALIASNGVISVDGKGYGGQAGPGAGGWVNNRGAGGGYGGRGGNCATGAVGGAAYGSVARPDALGSGGGGTTQGGAGGGAVHLIVDGVLTVDGQLSANGANAPSANGGGGSGGSLWIEAATIAGAGTISANGGNKGGYSEPGGGGGGRIALYTCDLQMPGAQIIVNGGTGWRNGEVGTILHGSNAIRITQQPAAQLVFFGSPVTFHVAASTTQGTLHYQWRKDDVDLENTGHYTGVLTHTLNIDAANYDDNGYYDVWLTDDCGNYVSDKARLIVPRPGDLNCDGAEDFGDINPFVLALTNPAAYQQKFPDCRLLQGDCNGDGLVDFGDINPFVRILTGP